MSKTALTTLPSLPFPKVASGKVREIYDTGSSLLIIATDRISAFDHILDPGIPGKGEILTQITHLWLDLLTPFISHHRVPAHAQALQRYLGDFPELYHRTMVVKKLNPLPIEAVVRGYLTGSSWSTYQKNGKVGEHTIAPGLLESARFEKTLFTPTTKSNEGHDESIDYATTEKLVGREVARQVRALSLQLYTWAETLSRRAKLILADTKFEFGLDDDGKVWLIDEALTPDSSRYWPEEDYSEGSHPSSFDKQYVRDFLIQSKWNFEDSPPNLPSNVVLGTENRYLEAWKRLQEVHRIPQAELSRIWNQSVPS